MEEKYVKVLVSIARIISLIKDINKEIDSVYENITDKEILNMFDIQSAQILTMEDYE